MSSLISNLSVEEKSRLLELARAELLRAANGESPAVHELPSPNSALSECRACFVTLKKGDELRGCVGQVFPREPLIQAVAQNVHNAALHDPRFPHMEPEEVPATRIEISVLTEPVPLAYHSLEELLSQLIPGETGLVLRLGGRTATYLPKVWEMVPDKFEFLESLSRKAGCAPHAWRGIEASILTFQAESFGESQPRNARDEMHEKR